jgi:ATP-dependent DNA helicase PIF1
MTIIEANLREQIHEFLRFLAGNCDGAKGNDGVGFNQFDAPTGHLLANQESLSPVDIKIGARLARKYHKQLEAAGYTLPDFSEYIKTLPVIPTEPPQQQENKTSEKTNNPDEITLSSEQQAIFELMEDSRQHLFITGRAGAGKSVILRHFVANTKKNCVVCAPTGIAAINAKGQTIHSLFKLGIGLSYPGTLPPNEKACRVLKGVDCIIIDEASMVRSDLMDKIDERMREAKGSHEPFGGAQVIMIGDVFQLPPIVEDDKNVRQYFDDLYGGGTFFFHALVWEKASFKIFELQQVFRQKDPVFKEILNAVRDGTVTDEQIERLNARTGISLPEAGCVTLAPSNSLVTNINQARLDALPGEAYRYEAEIVIDPGKKSNFQRSSNFPTEDIISLKVGAQVVLLKNDQHGRWVNGTIGIISALTPPKPDAKDINERYGRVSVSIDGISYAMERNTWEDLEYEYDGKKKRITSRVIASFTQWPLRLAFALTIHKSQGQTYDQVCVDLSRPIFAHGQLYVALSRVTSPNGLYLKLPVLRKHVIVDPKVVEFMARRETIIIEVEEPEEIFPEPVIVEADPPQEHIVHTEPKPKHAGGRPAKGRVRVNIKITPELKAKTEDIDRSQLIIDLLNKHFGIQEE